MKGVCLKHSQIFFNCCVKVKHCRTQPMNARKQLALLSACNSWQITAFSSSFSQNTLIVNATVPQVNSLPRISLRLDMKGVCLKDEFTDILQLFVKVEHCRTRPKHQWKTVSHIYVLAVIDKSLPFPVLFHKIPLYKCHCTASHSWGRCLISFIACRPIFNNYFIFAFSIIMLEMTALMNVTIDDISTQREFLS